MISGRYPGLRAMEMYDLLIQMMHRNTFKQTWAADPGIHKVFNLTFFTEVKCLRTCRPICVEYIIKWLLLFSISSHLIWARVWTPKLVHRCLKGSGYATGFTHELNITRT